MTEKNFYEVLQVRKDATLVEIRKAYYKLVKQLHPDKKGYRMGTKEEEELFVQITEAYQVLREPNKRRIYDRELLRENEPVDDSSSRSQASVNKAAETYFKNAVFRYKKGDIRQSLQLFEAALHLDRENPKYLSYYGLALSHSSSTIYKAREYCEKALEMEFYQPSFYTNLGIVYFNARLYSRAKKQLETALKWDTENKRASEYMQKINKIEKSRSSGIVNTIKKLFHKN